MIVTARSEEVRSVVCNGTSKEIFGTWEFEKRIINGNVNMAHECCEYVDFFSDHDTNLNVGEVRSYGITPLREGYFEIVGGNITFDFDGDTFKYHFDIEDDNLKLQYTEDNRQVIEIWVRR